MRGGARSLYSNARCVVGRWWRTQAAHYHMDALYAEARLLETEYNLTCRLEDLDEMLQDEGDEIIALQVRAAMRCSIYRWTLLFPRLGGDYGWPSE